MTQKRIEDFMRERDEARAALSRSVEIWSETDAAHIEHAQQLRAELAERDARIAAALERLHAASVPLGMSTEQFQAHTIRDVCAILSKPSQDDL